jgi:hypothetical protein
MQEHTGHGDFDFDAWAELAETDPEAFEIKRIKIIGSTIAAAPRRNRQKLRRLQWKLDRIRDSAPTPLAACVRMQELLWDSVLGDDGLLARLNQLPYKEKHPPVSAEILDFRRRRSPDQIK